MAQPNPADFFCVDPPVSDAELEAGRKLFAQQPDFLLSAASLTQLPEKDRLEICFAGRSNVGKSSLINALTGRKGLARASNTPGRTQHLNYFQIALPHQTTGLYFVDLPGYGYAKAPLPIVREWQALLKAYLGGRPNLRRAFVLIDSRHGVKAVDHEIMDLLDRTAVPFQIILTKTDKPKTNALAKTIEQVKRELLRHPTAFPQILQTSSQNNIGIEALRATIAVLLAEDSAAKQTMV